jgi:gliding motility-associated-like protein
MNKQYFTTAAIKVQQFVLAIIILMILPTHLMAQSPSVSYGSGLHTFTAGVAITPLVPTSANVSPQGYSSHIDTITTQNYTNYSFAVYKNYIYHGQGNVYTKIPVTGGAEVAVGNTMSDAAINALAIDTTGNVLLGNIHNSMKIFSRTGIIHYLPVSGIAKYVATDVIGSNYLVAGSELIKLSYDGSKTVSRFTYPTAYTGLAVDNSRGIYMVSTAEGKVYKVAEGKTPVSIASGFINPTWVATDAGNNIYVADKTTIKQIAPDRTTVTTLLSGLSPGTSFTKSATIDEKGYLYLATAANPGVSPAVYLQKVRPNGGYHLSKQLPDGLTFDNNTGIISGTPKVGGATRSFTVYVYNNSGGGSSANLSIKILSNIADLSTLVGRIGTIAPAFDRNTLNYNVTVANNILSYFVTPTLFDPTSTMTVNGKVVKSGVRAPEVNLVVGANVFNIVVTASDGVTSKNYKVTVTRLPSSNATLTSLGTSNLTTPYFSPSVYNYTYKVSYQATTAKIQPGLQDATASVTVNGTLITPTQKFVSVNLNMGLTATTTIVVQSKAQDGVTTNTYTIVVSHLPSAENQLKDLTLSPGVLNKKFKYDIYDYTTSIRYASRSFNVTPLAKDTLATVTVNGTLVTSSSPSVNVPLRVGNNKIVVKVVAQNGDNHHYYNVLAVRKTSSANNKLAGLNTNIGSLSPAFDPAVNYYDPLVTTSNVSSFNLTAITQDTLASIKVNDVPAVRGVPLAVPLVNGNNKIRVTVTAENGDVNYYTFYVKRAFANNAGLSLISLSTKSLLTRIINTDTLVTYTASVAPGTASVKQMVQAGDPNATIKVNGIAVPSGTESGSIALNASGTTTINTVVTAFDGTTKKYRITISKTGSSNSNLTSLNLGVTAILTKGVSSSTYNTYTTSVDADTTSVTIIPVAMDLGATIKVNGATVSSGAASAPVALNATGTTTITTVVTAPDGTTTKTYEVIVAKSGSSDANLSKCTVRADAGASEPEKLSTSSVLNTYLVKVGSLPTNVQFTPTASNPGSVIRVNGNVTTSGHKSILMGVGYGDTPVFDITVTAPNGTVKTYRYTVVRKPNIDAGLKLHRLTPNTELVRTYISSIENRYSTTVPAGTTSVQLLVATNSLYATVKLNGVSISPNGLSYAVPLNATGTTTLTAIVTAEDTAYKKKYIIAISKASSFIASTNSTYKTIGIVKNNEPINTHPDVVVRQAVSPNGDGVNDALTIDGLAAYPDNKVSIIDRTGNVVYELKGYDGSRTFDGHKSNGAKMQQGTYFYSVEYRDEKGLQRKTGYLVLKY